MENSELITKVRNAKYNIENAKKQLSYAKQKLSESITINGMGFKEEKINSIQNTANKQINYINTRVIPKINE